MGAMLTWQEPDLVEEDLRYYSGDPAEVLDALSKLMLTVRRPPWMKFAACRGKAPEVWFRSTAKPS